MDFLARGSSNSSDLPSGPSAMTGTGSGSSFSGDSRGRPGRFSNGPSGPSVGGPVTIDQSRLPTCAPFTAFIGNLSFDVTETDIRTFFQMRGLPASSIIAVKLPRDPTENRLRGFGYVEFVSVDELTRALLASNQFSVRNRVLKIDLSDSKPQHDQRPAEANRNWRDNVGSGSSVFAGRDSARDSGRDVGNFRGHEQREPRQLSAAESSMNWRDGPRDLAPAPVRPTPSHVTARPMHSEPAREAETVRNWRDTAHSVEKTEVPVPVVAKPAEQRPVPVNKEKQPFVESKVPTGSWRR